MSDTRYAELLAKLGGRGERMITSQSTRVEGSGQTVDYTEHITYDDRGHRGGKLHQLRVLIHVDSYPSQAWGRVERWDGTKWHAVVNVRGESLIVEGSLGYTPEFKKADAPLKGRFFSDDRKAMLILAQEVL